MFIAQNGHIGKEQDVEEAKVNKLEIYKSIFASIGEIDENKPLEEVMKASCSRLVRNASNLAKKERKKMNEIMNLILFLQMKKLELMQEYTEEISKVNVFQQNQVLTNYKEMMQDKMLVALRQSVEAENTGFIVHSL